MSYNVTISNNPTSGGAFSSGNPDTFRPNAPDAIANAGYIGADLSAGVSVTVITGTVGSQSGDITVSEFINGNNSYASLGLMAAGSISLNQGIYVGSGVLVLSASSGTILQAASAGFSAENLSINSQGGVSLNSNGNAFATLSGLQAGGDVSLFDTDNLTLSGSVNVNSHDFTIDVYRANLSSDVSLSANDLNLNASGSLVLEGITANLATLAGSTLSDSSNIVVSHQLVLDLDNASTIQGVISGAAALDQVGSGAVTLTALNTYSGPTLINNGALVIDGSISSAVTVTTETNGNITTNGQLGGTGQTGSISVEAQGVISPGDFDSSGLGIVGHLHTGAINLQQGAVYVEQVGSTSSFDQITANGNVNLGGASLDLAILNQFAPTSGTSYDILHVTNGTISGEFAQGSSVSTYNGYTFAITYSATDVTLSYPAPSTPPPPPPAPGQPPGSHVLTPAADFYQAGSGGEIIYGEGGSDTLLGGSGADTLSAGDYASTVGSTSDRPLIEGGAGDDSLIGGIGHNTLLGQSGNDHIMVAAGSQGDGVYGGQGDDYIDASQSNAFNYLSGDIGNDTILSGAGFETVVGGQGNDSLVGGSTAGVGSLQLLFGNQGADTISYGGHGSVQIYGGQDGDTLSVSTGGQGQTHLLFGNLGDDTLTASGGYNSLYGGQGNDTINLPADFQGHDYLSGDLGNDLIESSRGGFETISGGMGADTIIVGGHSTDNPDTILVGRGESTAAQGAGESNLDEIANFNFSVDHIVISGHSSGSASNVTTYADSSNSATGTEASAFAAAYLYAFGDGTSAHAAHVNASEYLLVQENYGSTTAVYLFTADHTALAFYAGATLSAFQPGDIVGG